MLFFRFFRFRQNLSDTVRGDIALVKFAVNRHEHDASLGCKVVNQTIARALSFSDIAVGDADLEDGETVPGT